MCVCTRSAVSDSRDIFLFPLNSLFVHLLYSPKSISHSEVCVIIIMALQNIINSIFMRHLMLYTCSILFNICQTLNNLFPIFYPCIHSLCLCLCSCPENWCILKPLCLCVPQNTLHPQLYQLCTSGMFWIHQVKRSPGKSSATSMVLLSLSMIPSNFDQIYLGNDNGKLVIENDLKLVGHQTRNCMLHLGLKVTAAGA